jgi:hypothetical protein
MTAASQTPGRTTYHCPRCRTPLEQEGEVVVAGQPFPVFSCPTCLVDVELFGVNIRGPLTFAVDPTGRPFDPATEDGELPPPAPEH